MKEDSAFPEIYSSLKHSIDRPYAEVYSVGGLTKREYFAGLAFNALLRNQEFGEQVLALKCVKYADALLKEFENK